MAMGCDSKSASEGKVSGAIANEEHKAQQEKQEKEEQVWEDVDSDDQNTFFLDPEGRVPFAGEVSFGFRCAPRALASALSEPGVLTRVVADCQANSSTARLTRRLLV